MSVQMNVKLNSKTLVEQLKKSLASITEKFEELKIMYDDLMRFSNRKIKNFVTNKKSKRSSNYIDTESKPIERWLASFENVPPDAQKLFSKLKTKIKEREEQINNLKDTIKEQKQIIRVITNDIQHIINLYEEEMQKNEDNNRKFEQLARKIANSQELQRPRSRVSLKFQQIQKLLSQQNLLQKKYEDLIDEYSKSQAKYQSLFEKNIELVQKLESQMKFSELIHFIHQTESNTDIEEHDNVTF